MTTGDQMTLELNLSPQSTPEKIIIQDIPGLEIQDLVGNYAVLTKREEKKGYSIDIHTYRTMIFTKRNNAIPFSESRTEILRDLTNYKLDVALDIHDFIVREISELGVV